MPLVTIKIHEGRTVEQKRGLVRDVTDAVAKNVGCEPDKVIVVILDLKSENIGTNGKLFIDEH